MAQPNTSYDIATITNPSGALTDFTLLIDLSRMTNVFKNNWNTSAQGYGRAYKDTGLTELPCDWININHTAKTGWLRVKWTGSLATTGIQKIRIYPPNTGNTQYAVTDPYGRNNTYTNAIAIYPFDGDANGRSGNEYALANSVAALLGVSLESA